MVEPLGMRLNEPVTAVVGFSLPDVHSSALCSPQAVPGGGVERGSLSNAV